MGDEHKNKIEYVFSAHDSSKELLQFFRMGKWVAEVDTNKLPRLYGDDTMRALLEVPNDITPEKLYELWYSHVFSTHFHVVRNSVREIKSGKRIEIIYPWMNQKGRLIYIRSVGERDFSYTQGVRFIGYFQDVTRILLDKQIRPEPSVVSEFLIQVLTSTYEAVHIINLRTQMVLPVKSVLPDIWCEGSVSTTRYMEILKTVFVAEQVQWIINSIEKQVIFDEKGRKTYYATREVKRIYNQSEHWYNVTMCLDQSSNDLSLIVAFQDINEQYQIQSAVETLRKRSETDGLTKVLNRITIEERINEYIRQHPTGRGILLLLDLDNFKGVNDELGHREGDVLLIETAQKLKDLCRSSDEVGRLGGDEFLIFLKDIQEECVSPVVSRIDETFHDFVQHLIESMKKKYNILDGSLQVTASIGVSQFPNDGMTFSDLYQCADTALYDAKRKGKNTYTLYTTDLQEQK